MIACSANIPGSLGEYQDEAAQTQCKSCPKFSTASYGLSSIEGCECGSGYFFFRDACVDQRAPVISNCGDDNRVVVQLNTDLDRDYGTIDKSVAATLIPMLVSDNCQAFSPEGVKLFGDGYCRVVVSTVASHFDTLHPPTSVAL